VSGLVDRLRAEGQTGLAADIERAEASLEKLNEQGFRRSPTYPYD